MVSLLERWTTPLDTDALLSALHPLWGRVLRGIVEGVAPANPSGSAASIRIRPGRGWRPHRPGHFVTVGVDVDGVRHHRCYSLTSLPGRPDGGIEITVQAAPGGVVSNHLAHHARPGDIVQLAPADGEFTLPRVPPARLLFVSGGSGITPLMGMLRWLAARGEAPDTPDVVLLHHAPSADGVLFAAELERLATTLPWVHAEVIQTRRRGGARLDAGRLSRLCPDWRERETYVCGPEALLGFAAEHWTAAGRADRLHVERFAPAALSTVPTSTDGTATARFAGSGVDGAADPGTPLLDVAERAGLRPAAGCRVGVCHTCSTRLDAGCVRDLRDGRLVEAGGHIQLCVTAAAGDVILDL